MCDGACLHAADGDGLAAAIIASTDGVVASGAFCGGDAGHALGNRDAAARGIVEAAADTRSIFSASGCDGAAVDKNAAARGFVFTAADTRTTSTASGCDGAAVDGDVAARGIAAVAAANTRSIIAASGVDSATVDSNVATRGLNKVAADARTIRTASDVECSAALDGEGLVFRYVDAGTIISPSYGVCCAATQDDDGVAQTIDAWPHVVIVIGDGGDVHAVQGHRGTVGDGDSGVFAARACEYMTVLELYVSTARTQRHHVCPRGGGDVHIDVGGLGAAAFVEVVTGAAAVCAHGTALGGVEGNASDSVAVRQGILGVVEVDVVATCMVVQVSFTIYEIVTSIVWNKIVGASSVG